MANVASISPVHRVNQIVMQTGHIPLSVTLSDTYAAASGGITISIATILSNAGINWADVTFIYLQTLTGYAGYGIKTATAGEFTIKFWLGAQFSDGAISDTAVGYALFSPGGVN